MTLAAGDRFEPYEIVSALGAGGMGEVYRARDTRLNRDVALKVLPDLFAADADRLARFQREAQLLASLNHPNIAAICSAPTERATCSGSPTANTRSSLDRGIRAPSTWLSWSRIRALASI